MITTRIETIFRRLIKRPKKSGTYQHTRLSACRLPGENSTLTKGTSRFLKLQSSMVRKTIKAHKAPLPQRIEGKNRLRRVLAGSLLLLLLGFGASHFNFGMQSLSFFKISELVIKGTEVVSHEQLRAAAGIQLHRTSMFELDADQAAAAIARLPWVGQVELSRSWPSTVSIEIVENRPVALVRGGDREGSLLYVDAKGDSLIPVTQGGDLDFPVITGLEVISDPQQRQKSLDEAMLLVRKLATNNPYLPMQAVSEVHVGQDGSLVLYLVDYPFPIFFGNGNTLKKYSNLVQVLGELYKKNQGVELISSVAYIRMDYQEGKVLIAQR